MHELIRVSEYRRVTLVRPLKRGGEGTIWDTDQPGLVAKTYGDEHHMRSLSTAQALKLQAMVASPPSDPTAGHHHVSIAWPCDLLTDANGSTVGFLMPKISSGKELNIVFNPKARRSQGIGISWLYLHTAAQNVAAIMRAVHDRGHVIGDVKSQNILVNAQALVSIVDTDSFQIRDAKAGSTFRCLVGSEGYTPPELIGVDLASTDQSELQDRFRLGVVIYQLLFMGQHPTDGTWRGGGDQPSRDARVQQGHWNFVPGSLVAPGPHTIPLDIVHPGLQDLFMRCFRDGWNAPNQRPSAQHWLDALMVARTALAPCSKVKTHHYISARSVCNWCERAKQTGYDPLTLVAPPPPPRTSTAAPKQGSGGYGHSPPSNFQSPPAAAPTTATSSDGALKSLGILVGIVVLLGWCSSINSSDTSSQQARESQSAQPASVSTPAPASQWDAQEVGAFLDSWKAGWESCDVDRYIQAYDSGFTGRFEPGGRAYNRSDWYAIKRKYAKEKSWIRVGIRDARATEFDGKLLTIVFNQRYESSNFGDETKKELTLIRRSNGWKIWSEQPLK